jgi:uroporphyrinogen decarboxylase
VETEQYTPRGRAVKALYGGRADRVPCVPLIDNSYSAPILGLPVSQCFIDPCAHAESLVACLERHPGIDGLSVNLCLAPEIILERRAVGDGYEIRTTGGTTWRVPHNDIGTVQTREITSFYDPRLASEDPLKAGILATVRAIPAGIRQRYLINCGVTGPFSQLVFLMGLERVLTATIDDPSGLHHAIQQRLPLALAWIDDLAGLDPGCIWIGEGVASSSLISAATYREFVLPYEQALADQIRRAGVPSVLHICGKIGSMLDQIPEARVDALELDWPVSLADAKVRIGKHVALKGNLNTTTLVSAGPDKIYRLAVQAITDAAAGGGFVLSSGCALGRDTPPANVEALVRAVQTHGSYGDAR